MSGFMVAANSGTPLRPVPPTPPPPNTNLAMPRGPINGFAQAADFYDSVGVAHHPEYLPDADLDTAIARIQELGLRHIRLGMFSPANHGARDFYYRSGNIGLKIAAANAGRSGGVQPIFALWGTTEEPAYEEQRGSAIYTMLPSGGTFLRPLDGPSGTVSATTGVSPYSGASGKLLQNAGTYYNQGWTTAAGLQGPNEPDNGRTTYWSGPGGLRDTFGKLKAAKLARDTTVVLGGEDYIDSTTGRITAGPAHANQLPVVASHLVNNNWANLGSASTISKLADCGCRHTYWGGNEPNWGELAGQWAGSTSYTGMPRFCTEAGYIMRGPDPGPGQQRYVPPEVGGELLIRTLITNYLQGVRRTYIYKLCDESASAIPPWVFGLHTYNWQRRAAFYAIKNLMTLVGFVQGSTSTPYSAPISGFTAGADNVHSDGKHTVDGLYKIVLQTPTGYLVLLDRNRMLWDRGSQTYRHYTDYKTLTLTLPTGVTSVGVAEPAKNPIQDPVDGLTYANPGNGTAYAPLTINGTTTKTVTFQVGALTRVVKIDL